MATSAEELRCEINAKESVLASRQRELEAYQERADYLRGLYNTLLEQKRALISTRNSISNSKSQSYEMWRGETLRTHQAAVDATVGASDTLVREVDAALDAINTQRAHYENKVSNTQGLIGCLKSVINSLGTQIQNWTN